MGTSNDKYLPEPYKKFGHDFPDLSKAFSVLAEGEHSAGPLDERSRRLIKLGIAVGAESQGGVRSQTRQALLSGLSEDEVKHAAVLALSTIGFPKTIAALGWVDDVIDAAGRNA